MEAIDLLKKEDKEFINLYYLSGQVFTEKDIALALHITQQGVSKKMKRIKMKLKENYIKVLATR